MLDPTTYRASEQLAKSLIPSWRVAQIHNLDHFERAGFPVRISSIRELGQIVDTMQENRFKAYMEELGGLSKSEFSLVTSACADAVRLQLTFLPHRPAVLPISTVLSAFALYSKLCGVQRNFRSLLEIGPGCGYLSFFLRRHASLENYSQIEACESFYLLQNLVNVFCFGPRFDERALPSAETPAVDCFMSPRVDMEVSPRIDVSQLRPKCFHYSWWRIGEIVSQEIAYDIVTSNANLLEFNASALDDYLALMHRVLRPEGAFLVQCTGFSASGTVAQLLEKLYAKGFAPLMFVTEGAPTSAPQASKSGLLDRLASGDRDVTRFTTNNALFVKQGHPLFDKYYDRKNYQLQFVANEQLVKETFFTRPSGRAAYGLADFIQATEARLASDETAPA